LLSAPSAGSLDRLSRVEHRRQLHSTFTPSTRKERPFYA
jgi:hypothetical protein